MYSYEIFGLILISKITSHHDSSEYYIQQDFAVFLSLKDTYYYDRYIQQ